MTKIPNGVGESAGDVRVGVANGGLLRVAPLNAPDLSTRLDPTDWLSPQLVVEWSQLTHETRRAEWLATRRMMFLMLGELGLPPGPNDSGRLHLERSDAGKLSLPHAPEWGVSVSHCQGFAAVLLAPGRVGVDVERYRPQVHRIAPRYLSPPEMAVLGQHTAGLILGWAVKEAVYKWMGGGGISFREDIRIVAVAEKGIQVGVYAGGVGERRVPTLWVSFLDHPGLQRVCAWVAGDRGG